MPQIVSSLTIDLPQTGAITFAIRQVLKLNNGDDTMEKLRETPTLDLDNIPGNLAEASAVTVKRPGQPILPRASFSTFIMAVITTSVLAESVLVIFAILPFANTLLLQIAFVLCSVSFGDWLIDLSNSSSELEA